MRTIIVFSFTLVFIFISINGKAEFVSSLQAAGVFPGYNDVRLPGNTGSPVSYSKDLDAHPTFSPRFEAGYIFAERHYLGLMGSLLTLSARGTLDRDVNYDNRLFLKGTEVKALYRFDSYRLTYRYDFFISDSFRIGAGLTGKVRDAEISLETDSAIVSQKGSLKNTGVVPLINYSIEWMASPEWTIYTYGDWLVSPYGRAEDIFIGTRYNFNNPLSIIVGYRILEGGSDSKEVYTFALFHYVVLGLEIRI